MELKGILGISHTESESGSGKSMLTMVEQGPSKVERINMSSYDEKSSYGSNQSVPQTSSGYESRGAINGYASSRASDWYSNRMKVLCSFGGKVLLRPSDRKLRYVGGETRIMCIARDISFQQLKQKVLAIYSEAHAIKYQLPGEDLDALVSVSCHEDLLNMMEEWSEVEDRESSHKLRLFLFSMRDLDDAQFGLGSIEGDSEMQYVVAVNGLDMGSRRSLTTHDLANSSGTNLAELDRSSIDREMSQVDTGAVGIGTSHLIGTVHSFQPIVQSSPSAHEIYPQFCQRQMMDHRATKQRYLHCCYSTSNYSPLYSTSICRFMNQEGWMNEGQPHDGFQVQNSYLFVKELKLTYDASVQQTVDAEKTHPSGKVYPVPVDEALGAVSMPGGGFQVQNLHTLKEVKATPGPSIQQAIDAEKICPLENIYMDPVDEISDAVSMPVGNAHSLPPKTGGKCQQPIKVSSSSDATNVVHVPKFCEDDQCSASSSTFGPGHTDAIPNPIDLSYLEPSLPSQRVYFSERIPREQAELLNRLSKSDDTLGSQFLISLADIAEGSRHAESVEKLPGGNLVAHTEPSVSAGKPFYAVTHTVDDGLPQLQKNKKFTDLASHTNTQFSDSEAVLECGSKPAVPSDGDTEDCEKGGRLLNADCEIDNSTANLEKVFGDGTREAGSRHSTAANVTSVMHHRDPASDDSQCADIADNDMSRDINLGQLEPPKKNGDIQIDIYDGFPCDLLSEIFSKGIFTDGPSGISLAHREGAGVNVNMENCERRHWSYFQKLAQEEFVQKDVSLLDQGHLGTPSAFMKADSEHTISYQHMPSATDRFSMGHEYSQLKFDENNLNKLSGISRVESTMVPDFDQAKIKESESMQFNAMIENLKSPESQYEDGNLENTNVGLPPFDPSLVDFDVNTLQIIKNEDLGELRELGSGTFGTVYHGKWRGTDVAIQRLKKICFAGCSSEQERLTLEFWREAEILSTLHHPNVMAFYGVVQNAPGGTLATVTEYMVDGSLRHVLLQKDRCLDHCRRLLIAMDAAFGMEYLHSKNIVHFDLKCDNLLINLKDPQRPICKVGDFGLSKIKRNTLVSGGVWGTLPWMAPELLNGSSDKVSEKVDVFSFGIVLWEILTGEEPYANMHYGTIIGGIVDNTLRPIIPTFCDPEWRRLMEQCWAPNPSFRPSFTEIVNRLHIMSTVAGQSKGHSNNASK